MGVGFAVCDIIRNFACFFTILYMKRFLLFAFVGLLSCLAYAQMPEGYYLKVNGLKKDSLKIRIGEIIRKAKVLEYGSGAGKTWTGFYTTDRYDGNKVRDRYSNDVRYFADNATAEAASAVGGMNIEHSFPKSWWGGTTNQAYKDLFNLMPCEQKINSSKSNYAMGVVTTAKTDNGCTKVGTGMAGKTSANLWEPADQWKGDFARSYFYMVTAYSDFEWAGEGLKMLERDEWPTLQEWAYKLLLKWNKQDPVDSIEIARNEAVYGIQGNRNPYVDFPNLAEYVWGDSVDVAFVVDASWNDTGDVDEPVDSTDVEPGDKGDVELIDMALIDVNFKQDCAGWEIVNKELPAGMTSIWLMDPSYGMKATSYSGGACHAGEAWLISPDIDLTLAHEADITFSHTGKYFGTKEQEATLWMTTDDGEAWQQLPINKYMSGYNWTVVENNTSLMDGCGKMVRVAFCYKGTATASGTWEILKCRVNAKIASATDDSDQTEDTDMLQTVVVNNPRAFYDLSGRPVKSPTKGVYLLGGRKVLLVK